LEQGIQAVGVDADAKTCADAQAKGLPVLCQNVFDYLAATPAASVDGLFSAHLVEHLAYPQVLKLINEAARILRPGGRIILATPDCRSLFSHLDMYYLHFGHVSFYHPRLLSFLLAHEGFGEVDYGVNPNTASPLLPDVQATANRAPAYAPGQLTDSLAASAYERLAALDDEMRRMGSNLQGINGPFECFATAIKPSPNSPAADASAPPHA
jgi:SAM-dependent methyltransferase